MECDINSNSTKGFSDAINAAENSDITVMEMGLNLEQESEGNDRISRHKL